MFSHFPFSVQRADILLIQGVFRLGSPNSVAAHVAADSILPINASSPSVPGLPAANLDAVVASVAAVSLHGSGSVSAEHDLQAMLDDANVSAAVHGGVGKNDGYSSDGSMPSLRTISDSSEESDMEVSDDERAA